MDKIILATRRFLKDEEGATAVEYGIMVSLIAVVIIAMVAIIGRELNEAFNTVAACLETPADC